MKCPNCNKEVQPLWQVCPFCQYKPKRCSNNDCNTGWLPQNAHFCPKCGSPVAGEEDLNLRQRIENYISSVTSSGAGRNGSANAGPDEEGTRTFTVNGVSFKMIKVEAGTFEMGDDEDDDCPTHEVTLTRDYYIGETPVTQALWEAVMGNNPSQFQGRNRPVENVSWNDCMEFVKKLKRLTNQDFRFPTEAEWEFAARGGNSSEGYEFAGSDDLDDVGWYNDNSDDETHPVKRKSANELGIYDMSGNVWEWCWDWYDSDYYDESPERNPTGAASGSSRVGRGGSWSIDAGGCRVALRFRVRPGTRYYDLGFRLAL